MGGPGATSAVPPRGLRWEWLGRVYHAAGTGRQRALGERLLAGDAGAARVLLLEHHPVITLGRSAGLDHLRVPPDELAARGVELVRTRRGGDITYHGPGQLIVYPVVRVRRVVDFLMAVAGALAELAAALGVSGAEWRRDPAGLWLGDAKLAACGVHLHRRVTGHGFALDVDTPAAAWQMIVPCGLSGARTTSIAHERRRRGLPPPPPMAEIAALAGPLVSAALSGR